MSRLPSRRRNATYRIAIGDRVMHVTTSCWIDGGPAEVFVDVRHREGTEVRALIQTLAISASDQLQGGVPLRKVIQRLRSFAFEPAGVAEIGEQAGIEVSSQLDAIALVLEAEEYLAAGGDEAAFWRRVRVERGCV